MVDRIFTMTRAAREAILTASGQGLSLNLTHLAIGSGRYAPTDAQAALATERLRLPIGESQKDAAALQLNLASAFRGPPEFYVSEIGVFAGPMLVFVWSDPALDAWITFLKSDVDFLLNVAIATPDLPAGAVTITDAGQALGLNLTPLRNLTAALAAEVARLGVRDAQRLLKGQ